MRTIKFRGKRIDNGEWVYGFLMQTAYDDIEAAAIFTIEHSPAGGFATHEIHEVVPKTVGQALGILRTEQEVFENDIVQHGESVRFLEVRNGNTCATRFSKTDTILLTFCEKPILIGNIYDNPELL